MSFEGIQFPVYRKYKNGRNYFKVLNTVEFEEIVFVGEKPSRRLVKATQYPEKRFIRELIFDYHEYALEIDDAEYKRAGKGLK